MKTMTRKAMAARDASSAKTDGLAVRKAKAPGEGKDKDMNEFRREAARRAPAAGATEEKPVSSAANDIEASLAEKVEARERALHNQQLVRIARKRIVDQEVRAREDSKRKVQRERQQEAEQRVKVDMSTLERSTGNEVRAIDLSPCQDY